MSDAFEHKKKPRNIQEKYSREREGEKKEKVSENRAVMYRWTEGKKDVWVTTGYRHRLHRLHRE